MMRKYGLLFFLSVWMCGLLSAQQSSSFVDFEELTDTKPVDLQKWAVCKKGVHSAWGSTDVRYSKTNVPEVEGQSRKWQAKVWRGERINAQALLWSGADCKDIEVVVGDLQGKGGAKIPASSVRAHFVRYVMTDELNKDKKGTCGYRPDRTVFDSSMVADILDVKKVHDLKAKQTLPVWLNIRVPEATKSGVYRGKVYFKADGAKIAPLDIELTVLSHVLPAPKEWAFWLDLWQNPYAVARYHNVPLWSEAHFEAMRPMMELLADAGQKCITASIMHKPWGGQTEDHFESMVMRIRKIDGTWAFDYGVFDRWVEFMMGFGINKQISCYSMIPWKLSFQYFDQGSNSLKFVDAKPGSAEYREYWMPFLKDFAAHLKQKGWFDIAMIAMDERPMDQMQQAIALIQEADPAYKIALAGNYHKEIEEDIHDYSIAIGHAYPKGLVESRRAKGMTSTIYTCCSEAYPNMFTFSPPAESPWHAWFAAATGVDGYLRWAYNSWVKAPLTDSRFRAFGAGDCYQVYPNGRGSIRMERLVEGIQDFEKIRILKELYKDQPEKLQPLSEVLSMFKVQKLATEPAGDMIVKARKVLNEL